MVKACAYHEEKGVFHVNYDEKVTGRVISELRREKGVTQEVLSGLAGVARSHLAMIESGTVQANVDTLWRISEALGLRLSELIRMVEDRMK